MAISSAGYAGTVNEIQWAQMSKYLGLNYGVAARADLACTQIGVTKTFSIAAGEVYGAGVTDTNGSAITITPAVPGAGGQWFLIVAHRVWATKLTTIIALAGATTTTATPSSVPAAFPAMDATPGTSEDQALFWVWVNSANTTTIIVDLRKLPLGIAKAGDATARDAYWGAPTTVAAQRYLQSVAPRWTRNDIPSRAEQYFAAYHVTQNPAGLAVAGWYPVDGVLPGLAAFTDQAQTIGTGRTVILFGSSGSGANVARGGLAFNAATGVATVPEAGVYRITGQITYNATTSGARTLSVDINGATRLSSIQITASIATLSVDVDLVLAAGSTVNLSALAGSAATIPVSGNNYFQTLGIEYLSPA